MTLAEQQLARRLRKRFLTSVPVDELEPRVEPLT
jgi:hypothetical protein